MTQGENTEGAPWWESELPVIRKELGAYLGRHLPGWRADYDDLVNDTLLALTRQIHDHSSAFPGSWFQPGLPENDAERSHLHRLTMVILKRRIADFFRKRAPLSHLFVTGEHHPDVADPDAPTPERKVLLARMLEVTLSVLSGMQPADRDLIAFIAGEAGLRKALDARERQRLHRLRTKLRDEILRRLGADAADLLQNGD